MSCIQRWPDPEVVEERNVSCERQVQDLNGPKGGCSHTAVSSKPEVRVARTNVCSTREVEVCSAHGKDNVHAKKSQRDKECDRNSRESRNAGRWSPTLLLCCDPCTAL